MFARGTVQMHPWHSKCCMMILKADVSVNLKYACLWMLQRFRRKFVFKSFIIH